MKVLTLVNLFAVILCVTSFQTGCAITIHGGNQGVVIIGNGTVGTPPTNLDIGRLPPKSDYRNPIPYTSPPVSIPPIPPETPSTPNATTVFGGIMIPRNESRYFNMASDVHGTGRFSIQILEKNPLNMEAKHSSSGINGQLDLSSLVIYYEDYPTYNTTSMAVGDNSTIWTLDALVPTLMVQQSGLRFAGSLYNEKNQYENNGDTIENHFLGNAIRKNSTYVGTLERLLQIVNVTGNKSIWYPALYNKSMLYNLNTRFVGDYDFDAKSASNNMSTNREVISQSYRGAIALNQNILSKEYFNRTLFNDTCMACYNI